MDNLTAITDAALRDRLASIGPVLIAPAAVVAEVNAICAELNRRAAATLRHLGSRR